MAARVALTLRMVGGLTTPEIARAFLVPESTMAQRLARAKAEDQGRAASVTASRRDDQPDRVTGVLAVVFLVFNEGYLAT